MNQTEKRRKRLLEQTRNLYYDRKNVPAVHPRYKALYQQVYSDEPDNTESTFGIRMLICILVFAVYVMMEQSGNPILGIDNLQVIECIMQNYAGILF